MPRLDKTTKYPYNLLNDIANRRPGNHSGGCDWELPEDIDESLAYVLAQLKDRQRLVIELRYEKNMTYSACGRELGVSSERIRQILSRALNTLVHNRYLQYLVFGMAKVNDMSRCKPIIDRDIYCNDLPIEELNLSSRSYTCLKRAGINTITDINIDDLQKVRNLGFKSFMEITEKLKKVSYYNNSSKWIIDDVYNGKGKHKGYIDVHCDKCGFDAYLEERQYGWQYGNSFPWKYCPACGAKMVGTERPDKKDNDEKN